MNNMRNKILMTLVALLAMTTGAWAQEEYESFDLSSANTNVNGTHFTITGTSGMNNYGLFLSGESVTVTSLNGENITRVEFIIGLGKSKAENITGTPGTNSCTNGNENGSITDINATSVTLSTENTGNTSVSIKQITVYYGNSEPAGPEVTWDAATKTGTFEMPAFDVEIAPIYAPKAVFATDGNLVLTPTAIEGVYAESTDAIVKAGTVAKIGETEDPQGIVMYAVTSTNQATAPALTAFSADVPTAKDITIGSEVLVWYYIKGADTPQGQDPSAENTFNDSEICTTPITVNVLSNKFDIQFNAANANTIEAGKATVKVGDAAATVTDGKIEKVKMGSKVTITAKDGYKFRKAEGKKGKVEVFTVEGQPFYFIMGENWQQAIESHPTENANWIIDGNRAKNNNGQTICYEDSGDPVELTSEINPKTQYTLRWGF